MYFLLIFELFLICRFLFACKYFGFFWIFITFFCIFFFESLIFLLDLKRICCRCGSEFTLTPKGECAVLKQCVYHWGKAFKTKSPFNCFFSLFDSDQLVFVLRAVECRSENLFFPFYEFGSSRKLFYKIFSVRGLWESRYNCCQSDLSIAGCCVADCHVTDAAPKSVLGTYVEVNFWFFELPSCSRVPVHNSLLSYFPKGRPTYCLP